MLKPGSWACWTTQSMAAMTWLTSAEPSPAPTLTLTTRASGATPTKPLLLSATYARLEVSAVSRPTMIEAMCVPWPNASFWVSAGFWESKDKSGPLTMLPLVNPATGATPESIMAMSTPAPA